ncbi:ferritin light chain, oocyte isoform [Bombina bombina]|uniref:ferritin light chain, oocyte isoform n=1 Tax=Bombina bombina TaxID=8345 RepID=UPI00235A4B36|nr:ferritin light chain, oocyte isoform [Bombina bombina]
MAEPKPKRVKGALPSCPKHFMNNRSGVRQNFPPLLEEGLCGVSSVLMQLSYRLLALAEVFDQSNVALARVSKFFLEQSEEEQRAAEALLKHMTNRGGYYCSKTLQKPGCEHVGDVMTALHIALNEWKTILGYLEELYNISIDLSDPHTAGVIKKHFIEPKVRKVKVTGDLLTNTRRLGCTQDGKSSFGEYLIDRLEEELK